LLLLKSRGRRQVSGMSPSEVLLLLIVVLLTALVFVALAIKASLHRIERAGPRQSVAAEAGSNVPDTEETPDGPSPFDEFLAEDPSRLALKKSEQAAAYREWRKQKGMNWSNS